MFKYKTLEARDIIKGLTKHLVNDKQKEKEETKGEDNLKNETNSERQNNTVDNMILNVLGHDRSEMEIEPVI